MTPINRREFLAATAIATAAAGLSRPAGAQAGTDTLQKAPPKLAGNDRDWSKIHGFNYQPSYGSTGLELWQKFDAKTIEIELERGKKYFPGMNALRWWQSWDAFQRDPKSYARHFESTLVLAEKYGCVVIPVLFNRWHDSVLDYGGIYIDHFYPESSFMQQPKMFDAYLGSVLGAHQDDPRILAWDLCNEPYFYTSTRDKPSQFAGAETAWLRAIHDKCKALGARAPLTVGVHMFTELEFIDPLCDVFSVHPYLIHNDKKYADKPTYEKMLDSWVAHARKVNKPLIATECCWGDLNDRIRVDSIRYTLTQLKKRGIGYLVYLLHHSLIADAHRPEFGPVGFPGNLSFIEADGSLRPGHDIFNEF